MDTKHTMNVIDTYQKGLDAGMEFDEEEVFADILRALEKDNGGPIDISNISMLTKIRTRIEIFMMNIQTFIEVWILGK